MTACDVGPILEIDAGGYNLTGCACVLLAAPGRFRKLLGTPTIFSPISVAAGGLTASYAQNGKDFTTGGFWTLELQVTTPAGEVITSPPGYLYVFPRLV